MRKNVQDRIQKYIFFFQIQVNNEDVRKKPHSELVKLVGSLKTEVCLKVVHVPKFKILSFEAKKFRSDKKKAEENNTSLAEVGQTVPS